MRSQRHEKQSDITDCARSWELQSVAPTSAATGESLRDIGFLRFRDSRIGAVKVMQIGLAGTLAYELYGPTGDGPEIYDAGFEAGRAFSLERVGWQTYPVNHV